MLDQAIAHKGQASNLPAQTGEDISNAFQAVIFDHPEYAYCPGVTLTYNGTTNIPYLTYDDNVFINKVNQVVQEITNALNGRDDDYSKVKAIFDYLTTHLEYDYGVYNRVSSAGQNDENAMIQALSSGGASFSPYGALVLKKAVCEGIARAFKLFCDLFNVACRCVKCYQRNQDGSRGDGHMNNLVSIEGVDSFVDVTFALPHTEFPIVLYQFFLTDLSTMNKYVIFDEENIQGSRSRHNYFAKHSCSFHTLDKLRPFLRAYDARYFHQQILFEYDGDEIKEDKMREFTLEILNHHLPPGRQWIGSYSHGYFLGLLVDSHQMKKLQQAQKSKA